MKMSNQLVANAVCQLQNISTVNFGQFKMQGGARLGCETTSVPCKMGLTKYRTSAKQIALYTHTAVKKITL